MQVVFISPHCDPEAELGEPDSGGQCLYELELAKALVQINTVEVTIYCRQTFKRPDTTHPAKKVTVRRLVCDMEPFIRKEEMEVVLPQFADQVTEELRGKKDVVIHSHYWDGGKAALMVLRRFGTLPTVWTPHSLGFMKRQKFPGETDEKVYNFVPRILWENYAAFMSHQVIVSTPQESERMQEFYSVTSEKVKVVPPGIDLTAFQEVDQTKMRAKYKLPIKGKIILCIGRMARTKGYHHAIQIFSQVKKLHTEPVYLVVCGGSGSQLSAEEQDYFDDLKQLTKLMKVEHEVFFRPAVTHEKINEMYGLADIHLVSAMYEPFGLTVLEAMAMSRPVVATNRGGPAHTLKDGETGCLVDIKNYTQSAFATLNLLKDEKLYRKIAQQARQAVIDNYSWPARAKQFHKVYLEAKKLVNYFPFHRQIQGNYFLQHNL